MRERRRQRGLPLPSADKVLPFRPATGQPSSSVEAGEECVAEAWAALQAAEQPGRSRRVLLELEEAHLFELDVYRTRKEGPHSRASEHHGP